MNSYFLDSSESGVVALISRPVRRSPVAYMISTPYVMSWGYLPGRNSFFPTLSILSMTFCWSPLSQKCAKTLGE